MLHTCTNPPPLSEQFISLLNIFQECCSHLKKSNLRTFNNINKCKQKLHCNKIKAIFKNKRPVTMFLKYEDTHKYFPFQDRSVLCI